MRIRTQVLIGLTTLLGVLVTFALAWIFFPRRAPDLSRLLPADAVDILLTDVTAKNLIALHTSIPATQSLTLTDAPVDAVYIDHEGATEWFILDRLNAKTTADDPAFQAIIATPGPRLIEQEQFRKILRTRKPGIFWGYIHQNQVPDTAWQPLTKPTTPVAVRGSVGSLEWILPIADETHELTALASLLSEERRLQAAVLLTSVISDAFGTNVSARYDILPLVEENGAVRLGQDGTLTLLQGWTDSSTIKRAIPLLHASVQKRTRAVVIDRHAFEGGFDMDIVRVEDADESLPAAPTETVHGWTTVESGGSGAGLWTATRGETVLVGTDEAAFTAALATTPADAIAPGMYIIFDPSSLPADILSLLPSFLAYDRSAQSLTLHILAENGLLVLSVH